MQIRSFTGTFTVVHDTIYTHKYKPASSFGIKLFVTIEFKCQIIHLRFQMREFFSSSNNKLTKVFQKNCGYCRYMHFRPLCIKCMYRLKHYPCIQLFATSSMSFECPELAILTLRSVFNFAPTLSNKSFLLQVALVNHQFVV